MTLITTEIWSVPPQSFIVMAADRMITRAGQEDSRRRKLFALPAGRKGGISYFGLAVVQLESRTRAMPMAKWLPDFLDKNTGFESLGDLAETLADSLNDISRLDRSERSGFTESPDEGDPRGNVGSGGRTRTYDQAVNSRPLYH